MTATRSRAASWPGKTSIDSGQGDPGPADDGDRPPRAGHEDAAAAVHGEGEAEEVVRVALRLRDHPGDLGLDDRQDGEGQHSGRRRPAGAATAPTSPAASAGRRAAGRRGTAPASCGHGDAVDDRPGRDGDDGDPADEQARGPGPVDQLVAQAGHLAGELAQGRPGGQSRRPASSPAASRRRRRCRRGQHVAPAQRRDEAAERTSDHASSSAGPSRT